MQSAKTHSYEYTKKSNYWGFQSAKTNAIPCCSAPLVLTMLGVSRTGDRTGSQDIQALELPTGEPL